MVVRCVRSALLLALAGGAATGARADDPPPQGLPAADPSSLLSEARRLAKEGTWEPADAAFRAAVAAFRRANDAPGAARALKAHGEAAWDANRQQAALGLFREAEQVLAGGGGTLAAEHADCTWRIARALIQLGKDADAVPLLRRAIETERRVHGPDHARLSRAVADLAYALDDLDKPAEAVPLYEEALAMDRRLHPGDDAGVAEDLNSLAFVLNRVGRQEDAIARYRESLAMKRRLAQGDDPEVAQSLLNLGRALLRADRASESLPLVEEALAIRERLAPAAPRSVLGALDALATVLRALRRPGDAATARLRALELAERLGKEAPPNRAGRRIELAVDLDAASRGAEAEPYAREALAILREHPPDDVTILARALNQVGIALVAAERAEEALPFLREGLALYRREKPGSQDVASNLLNLSGAQLYAHHPVEALAPIQEAVAIARGGGGAAADDLPGLVNFEGRVFERLGRLEEALARFEEALALWRRQVPPRQSHVASALNNVGYTLTQLGRGTEAVPLLEQSLALRRTIGRGEDQEACNVLMNLAGAWGAQGERSKQADLHRDALALLRRLRPGDDPQVARALNNYGASLMALQQLAPALAAEEEALGMARRVAPEAVATYATNLGWGLLAAGRTEAAVPLLEEGVRGLESLRGTSRALDDATRRSYLEQVGGTGPYEGLAFAQLALERPQDAIGTLERSRARSVLELMERSQVDPLRLVQAEAAASGAPEAVAEAASVEGALREAEAAVSRATARRTAAGRPTTNPEALAALDQELRAAQQLYDRALGTRAHLIAAHVPEAAPLEVGALPALLGPKERLLMYVTGAHQSAVLLLGPSGTVHSAAVTDERGAPLSRSDLGELVRRHRLDLARGSAGAHEARGLPLPSGPGNAGERLADGEAGRRLAQGLLPASIRSEVLAAERVVLVPHGPLYGLPFETLPLLREEGGEPLPWLVSGPPIAYVPSCSVLAFVRARSVPVRPARDVVALGDPIFSPAQGPPPPSAGGRSSDLAPLPGSRAEVEAVAACFPGAAGGQARALSLLGREATEERLTRSVVGARYVHLATHYLPDDTERGSYGRLALTSPQRPEDGDGFLTVYEVFEHWRQRLAGCDLVVLSACESNFGPTARDEGPYGMPLAMLCAGARSVVASLWRVDDERTAELMSTFYARLAATDGKDRLAAFAEARRQLRERHPDPRFWGPFIYIGDPR